MPELLEKIKMGGGVRLAMLRMSDQEHEEKKTKKKKRSKFGLTKKKSNDIF